MLVLFLDIDGVLNSHRWDDLWVGYTFEGLDHLPPKLRRNACWLDHTAIYVLNDILERTGANVVISSAWRHNYTLDELQAMLVVRGFQHADRLIGMTPHLGHETRGDEIGAWLESTEHDVEGYLVLDDFCPDEFGDHADRLLQTSAGSGLRPYHVPLAVRMLCESATVMEAMRAEGWLDDDEEAT